MIDCIAQPQMNTINQETYEDIATEFSETRSYVWKCIKDFTLFLQERKDTDPSILEIGCGNGKNMEYVKNRIPCNIIGVDTCHNFLSICDKKHLQTQYGNSTCLPFPDNSFDYILCIAMFHHLLTDEDRNASMKEMLRVMKPNSYGIITCWSSIQHETSNFQFHEGINIVPWKGRKNINKDRYYYVYSESMFREYFQAFSSIRIVNIYTEFGNWVLLFQKN